ncbi:SMI1/KNR4 family protein [Halioxenophilus sp. WMMB6]|uniref:SMI1/KNR4 family protein n=1 Tax=Halioxenophilus sp. WMMB6 TaxID=3073815 RepID=UPI00295EB7A6|nr:SMI1/KNR4 family protein [Halioxenophilus sp. WMMB6]
MEEVIERLREANESVPVPLELPSFEQLVEVQEALLIHLPDEYREFLLEVSDVIYGHLEPATIADPAAHTYLPDMASKAWEEGLERHLLPICEYHAGYYVIDPMGEVSTWPDDGSDSWPNIWQWADSVWLDS